MDLRTSGHAVSAHTNTAESMYRLTDEDKFCAADSGTQPAQYDEMDMPDQPQQKLNNTVQPRFSNLPVSFLLFLIIVSSSPSSGHPLSSNLIQFK